MKKLILLLTLTLIILSTNISLKTIAIEPQTDDLTAIEQILFDQSFSESPIQSRLNKIEIILYGQTFENNSVDSRIHKIKTFVNNEKIGTTTSNSHSTSSVNSQTQATDDELSDAEINFFGKSYPNLDINKRLNRLENAIWGNVLGGDTDTRIVRVLQATKSINNSPGNSYAPQNGNSTNSYSTQNNSNSSGITSRNLYQGFGNDNYGYNNYSDNDEIQNNNGFTTPQTGYMPPSYSYTNPNYGYNNQNYGYNNQNYGYNNQNYGYNNQNYGYNNPSYGYNNYNNGYLGNYNNYNSYADPNYQYNNYGQYTPRGIFSSAAGAALNKVLKNKGGVLSEMGKAAGNAILGNPMGIPYNYNMPYNYPAVPYSIPY